MSELVHRQAGPPDGPLVCCVHGWPESGRMWKGVLDAADGAGLHVLAPDLPGYGHSPPQGSGTWADHVAALDAFLEDRGPVALIVHDWGGFIGLRWALDHPERISALVISDTGFFPDGKWHGFAETLRTPGEGEQAIENFTRDGFGQLLSSLSTGIDEAALDEYFVAFSTPEGRARQLALYRSGDMGELAAYEGGLDRLGVPTLILWGADDPFAPVAGAERFHREIGGSELQVLDAARHFAPEDVPEAYAEAATGFLTRHLLSH